jgi:hypothetical protein
LRRVEVEVNECIDGEEDEWIECIPQPEVIFGIHKEVMVMGYKNFIEYCCNVD